MGAEVVQIFTQSPRMWKPTQYGPEVLDAFRAARVDHPSVTATFCHATYLINLATPDPSWWRSPEHAWPQTCPRPMGWEPTDWYYISKAIAALDSRVRFPASPRRYSKSWTTASARETAFPVRSCSRTPPGPGTRSVGPSRSWPWSSKRQAVISASGCAWTPSTWGRRGFPSAPLGTPMPWWGPSKPQSVSIGSAAFTSMAPRCPSVPTGTATRTSARAPAGPEALGALLGHPALQGLPAILEMPGAGDGPRAEDIETARKVWRAGMALRS
jgi:hypothetical protein